MTSEFERDDIQDSSFPLEMTNEASLDQYGVWIKSGPRDVTEPPSRSVAIPSTQESPLEAFSSPLVKPLFESSLSDSGQLPDFVLPDFESGPVSSDDDNFDSDTLESTETLEEMDFPAFEEMEAHNEVDSLPDDTVNEFESDTGPLNSLSDVSLDSFEDITFDDLALDDDSATAAPESDSETVSVEFMEIPVFGNEMNSVVETDTEVSVKSARGAAAPDVTEFNLEEFDMDSFSSSPAESSLESAAGGQTDEVDQAVNVFFEDTAQVPGKSDTEDSDLSVLSEMNDFDLPADENVQDFLEDSLSEIGNEAGLESNTLTLPTDDDFSSFLDDLNTGVISDSPENRPKPESTAVSGSSDDLDLDSFIDSFNETGGADAEKERIYDDDDPVEIALEFDEEYITDTEKIKAAGSVADSEFYDPEFGVELIDETGGTASAPISSELDSLLEDIPDFGAPEKKVPAVSAMAGQGTEVTNEFDDLLGSLGSSSVPENKPAVSKTVDKTEFDLEVFEEDGSVAVTAPVAQTTADDELEVSLFGGDSDRPKAQMEPEKLPQPQPAHTAADVNMEDLSEFADISDMSSTNDLNVEIEDSRSFEADLSVTPDETISLDEISDEAFADFPESVDVSIPEIDEAAVESPFDEENLAITSATGYNDSDESGPVDQIAYDFDDVSAFEQDLLDTPSVGDGDDEVNDISAEILKKIADELASIKSELAELKGELGRKAPVNTAEPIVAPSEVTEDSSGFFADDDTDETIALTGDELNNILITADFTEEKEPGIDQELPADEGQGDDSVDTMPDSLDIFNQIQDPDVPESLPDSAFEVPENDLIDSVPIAHVTSIPDDISYLEGSEMEEPAMDEIALDDSNIETIDFDDEKLEEPILDEFSIDLSEIENSFGNSKTESDFEDDITLGELEPPVASELPVENLDSTEFDSFEVESFQDDDKTLLSDGMDIEEPSSFTSPNPPAPQGGPSAVGTMPLELKEEIKSVLSYMDQLLESLPEEKIEEFARSEHFEVYKKLFEELGIS